MTLREKVIVSAYTGITMCDPNEIKKYISEKLGRPIFTHELASADAWDEIKRATHDDFIKLCES